MAIADAAALQNESDQSSRAAGACVMVLFGAAGDLTKRKLIPSLFNLVKAKLLPKDFAVLGVSVDDLNLDQFRAQVTGFLPVEDRGTEAWQWFTQRLFYQRGEFLDPNTYSTLAGRLSDLDRERQTSGNYMFYLATSPKFFGQIVQQLGTAGLSKQEGSRWRRVIIENPSTRSRYRQGFEPRRQGGAGGKSDLSHRSLSGQRDGAEHHGFSFRQRHLRAHLEPALHRSCADHQC